MTVDLSKLILDTNYNSFKNANIYRGSIVLPTSVAPATSGAPFSQTTTSFTLATSPVFTTFWAFFNELGDSLSNVNNPQWYNSSVAGALGVGYPVVKDAVFGSIGVALYPVINGTTVTLIAQAQNLTAHTFTANITVPFAFVDYTLAN